MKCFEEEQHIQIVCFCFNMASKLGKVGPTFSTFDPFPSLPSVATSDRKQNICHNIVLNNKSRPFF